MKVADAGVLVELLVDDLDPAVLGDEELAAPHLVDSEVVSAIRGLVMGGRLTDGQGTAAVAGFMQLELTRFSAEALLGRVWALRHNLSAYDATYVALAEALDATSLLTTDARLARADGVAVPIELV